jgi:hypothetical protein
VLTRWYGGFAAIGVTLGTIALICLELTDAGFRRWWEARPLTTDTLSGVLVVLVTVLVVNQVITRRQVRDRSQAISAQAVIVLAQGMRTANAMTAALAGHGDRDNATDEMRTYMIMLLVGAPVLIDAPVSRDFLEQAQILGGELARAAGLVGKKSGPLPDSTARINRAAENLRAAGTPLLQILGYEELTAVDTLDSPDAPATT